MSRLRVLVFLFVLCAAVVAGAAAAMDIDEDFQPPTGIVGVPYTFQLVGRGGCENSYTFKLDGGTVVPPGLVLQTNGLITGTPTAAGTWDFYVELRDNCEPAFPNSKPSQGKFTVRIVPQATITTTSLAPTRIGVPYTTTLQSSGAETQWWSVAGGALPPGLALKQDGTLTGTPTAVGSFTFTVKLLAPGPDRVATKDLTLVVAAPVAAAAPAPEPSEVGVPFTTAPTTTGGAAPFAWSVSSGSLPAGLTLDAATGAIAGTPTTAGSFPVKLSVTEATGTSATVDLTLTVATRLRIATAKLPVAGAGTAYQGRLTARGGVGPVRWRVVHGKLPRGVRLDPRTGALAGVARRAGRHQLTLQAVDSLGAKATQALVLVVR